MNMNPHSLHTMLKESIERFLSTYHTNTPDFTDFKLIFSRVITNLPHPPSLDLLWFYSALHFHSSNSHSISTIKDLFHLLVSFSSTNAHHNIAAMAPVAAELFNLAILRRDLRNEVNGLLEGIIGYFSMAKSGWGVDCWSEGLGLCFEDLVRVWVLDRVGGERKLSEGLKVFVPGVSDGIRDGIGCGGVGYLAGVVMCEVLLLRLCLKVEVGVSRLKLEEELVASAVQMITAFRSVYFIDALLKMLLEPVLPVTCLLNIEGEDILRRVLYSAVIAVDYSFLGSQKGNMLPSYLKDLALRWVFVADNALRFVRENEDQNKFFCYAQAFSESHLPSLLIKWVTEQPGMQIVISKPNALTPVSLIKWLLIVEDQGVKVFDCELSKIYAKAIICKSRMEFEPLVTKSDIWNLNGNRFSYANGEERKEDKTNDDLQTVDFIEGTVLAASGLMEPTAIDNTKKRKEGRNFEGNKQCKFPKCHFNDNLARENFSQMDDEIGMDSWSAACNAVFDGDVQLMEQ